ncbi:hypothetical protein [Bailinhaonella thermotolerans]|uniref:RNase H type-1 domain-containing protein n=1 Tax=Bailinhaonella thermotolerans TaxID=1070861 RepID=A0A3A3ZZZ1_9ACTN|nr:hypothetical protein [Bailinhaonella thermotolerans]RJL21028.1 hypothetical protein D5H75_38085 [Bailinhaonella thermotolerans]
MTEPDPEPLPLQLPLQLPAGPGGPHLLATDGSSGPDACGHTICGYAAVLGDGRAIAGAFRRPAPRRPEGSSSNAELAAVRHGLRLIETGPVRLMLDEADIVQIVRACVQPDSDPDRLHRSRRHLSAEALREIADHGRRLQITVARAHGGAHNRLPVQPAARAAHCLAWMARRAEAEGVDLTPMLADIARAATSTSRVRTLVRQRYRSVLARHAQIDAYLDQIVQDWTNP